MDSTTMTNVIIILILVAIFWNVLDIRRTQIAIIKTLDNIAGTMQAVIELSEHSDEIEQNTIKALTDMCNALNQSFSTNSAFMNHTTHTLRNIAVCMIPFIDEIKERAVRNEEFEKAQECLNIINNLQELIKKA